MKVLLYKVNVMYIMYLLTVYFFMCGWEYCYLDFSKIATLAIYAIQNAK